MVCRFCCHFAPAVLRSSSDLTSSSLSSLGGGGGVEAVVGVEVLGIRRREGEEVIRESKEESITSRAGVQSQRSARDCEVRGKGWGGGAKQRVENC